MLADEVPKIKAIWTNISDDGQVWHSSLCVMTVQASETDGEWLWIQLFDGNESFWIALQSDNTKLPIEVKSYESDFTGN